MNRRLRSRHGGLLSVVRYCPISCVHCNLGYDDGTSECIPWPSYLYPLLTPRDKLNTNPMNTSSDKCSTICLFDPSVRWNVTFWTPGGVCATCGWTPPQVSQGMVDFLNLTGSPPAAYLQAYCLNPPRDDACPFGYCSNPDIAGNWPSFSSNLLDGFTDVISCRNTCSLLRRVSELVHREIVP